MCFKSTPLPASLLIYADDHDADPWLILTDLAPEAAEVSWYGLRAWIEASFKDTKRGGWQWQRTRMADPARASRLWLVLALALLYTIQVGSQTDTHPPASMVPELPSPTPASSTPSRRPQPRRLSLVTQGHLTILANLIRQHCLPALVAYAPNPWPTFQKTYP